MPSYILVCASCTLLVQSAAVPVQNCGQTFQTQLDQLQNTVKSCDSAAFYDCCQVRILHTKYTNPGGGRVHISFFSGEDILLQSTIRPIHYQGCHGAVFIHFTHCCDMETDGGGWMIIQRRLPTGTVDFTRNWNAYENGFGDLEGEFWYGLRNIHHLTTRDQVELRIDMVKETDGEAFSWTYQTFSVGGAAEKYRLTVGEGEGEGFDAMSFHSGHYP